MGHLDLYQIICYALAVLAVLPALLILFTRDIVRVAFLLLGSLGGVAGLYLTLGADFLGLTQVIVYLGGIMVLILFGIMMTRKTPIPLRPGKYQGRSVLAGLVVAAAVFAAVYGVLRGIGWEQDRGRAPTDPTIADLGDTLLTDYVLPFEVISVLLLVVLCGAAYMARRREEVRDA